MAGCAFVAGASGVVGRALARILIADGWRVVGTTRSAEKAEAMRRAGIEPVVVNVFFAAALQRALAEAAPDVVVHQLTDLPPGLDPTRLGEARERNARIRDEGTRNLVVAAVQAGAQRLVAQSVAFAYAEGSKPHREGDPLDVWAPGGAGVSARGVASLERQVMQAPLQGLVLRYGRLYGPGSGFDKPPAPGALHVDAAAHAARLAMTQGKPGIYNIAEDDGTVDIVKARRELGWDPAFRSA